MRYRVTAVWPRPPGSVAKRRVNVNELTGTLQRVQRAARLMYPEVDYLTVEAIVEPAEKMQAV